MKIQGISLNNLNLKVILLKKFYSVTFYVHVQIVPVVPRMFFIGVPGFTQYVDQIYLRDVMGIFIFSQGPFSLTPWKTPGPAGLPEYCPLPLPTTQWPCLTLIISLGATSSSFFSCLLFSLPVFPFSVLIFLPFPWLSLFPSFHSHICQDRVEAVLWCVGESVGF